MSLLRLENMATTEYLKVMSSLFFAYLLITTKRRHTSYSVEFSYLSVWSVNTTQQQHNKPRVQVHSRILTVVIHSCPGAHQQEPLSPILSLGVNPFPSRFIYRTALRRFCTHTVKNHPIKTELDRVYCLSSSVLIGSLNCVRANLP